MTDADTDPPIQATELVYHLDAYRKELDATVVAIDAEKRGIALDRTIVFPGGGGQPHDTGEVRSSDGRSWTIEAAMKSGPVVWHVLGGESPLPAIGNQVVVSIDWPVRYRLMRTHTALHVLCGTIFRDYGAMVTGANMGPDKARMDFEMEQFNPELVAEIERVANEEISLGRDIRVAILPRAEAFAIPDLIRTKINLLPEGIDQIRIVEIVGLDLQADGGTHVANTSECGGIRIVGTRSKGKSNKRIELILAGGEGDESVSG